MVGKVKCIPHGDNNLRYISGESENKKHPEKIYHVCDNLVPPGLDANAIWDLMQRRCQNHGRIRNSVIRIELSPAMDYTKDFTLDDWEQLWHDFIEEFDKIEMKDKNGKVYGPKTNLAGSISTAYVHYESDSGIPHLHAGVCRVDENGNTNVDHDFLPRGQQAADAVCRKRGWKTTMEVRERNIKDVRKDCDEVLKSMTDFRIQDFFNRMEAKGYDLWVRHDTEGVVTGYTINDGRKKYKSSDISRSLTPSRIEAYWARLHSKRKETQKPNQKSPHPVVAYSGKGKPKPSPTVPKSVETIPSRPSIFKPNYSKWRDGSRRYSILHNCDAMDFYIPGNVLDHFDEVFNYREILNWQELTETAVALFVQLITPPIDVASSGGGGSSNDNDWGRDPREEELEWARRCAQMAKKMIRPARRSRGVH